MQAEDHNDSRVLVIGLDGGAFEVLHPLIDAGVLPNLERMLEEGAWGRLQSTVPPHSAPAWSSFATGANPGRHGVYHFRPIDRRFYEGDFSGVVNARSIALPTMWARASQSGKRVGVINVPLTYPPEPLNGFMISGMLTPDSASVFTFPPELSQSLQDYVIDSDTGGRGSALERVDLQHSEGLDWFVRDLERQLEARARAAVRLFDQYQPDLAIVVFTETDRLHHFLWPCFDHGMEIPLHLQPYCEWTKEFYARLDQAIGRISDVMGGEATRIVMSDHGFGPYPTREFYANTWLRDLGVLKVRATSARAAPSRWLSWLGIGRRTLHRLLAHVLPQHQLRRLRIAWGKRMRLPIDWERTQAYFMPLFDSVGGIVLTPTPGSAAYDELRESLIDGLRELVDPDTGSKVVSQVRRREQVYTGPHAGDAPDVIFTLDSSYTGNRSLLAESHFGPAAVAGRQWTGTHRPEGILLMDGDSIESGAQVRSPRMEDLAPTILYFLDLYVPGEMDGRVLEEVIKEERLAAHPVQYSEGGETGAVDRGGWGSSDEEDEVARRLRALGYLE